MLTSKFKVGQVVFLNYSVEQRIREGAYIITKEELLGPEGDFVYCIKGVIEPCERVVKASQLKNGGIRPTANRPPSQLRLAASRISSSGQSR